MLKIEKFKNCRKKTTNVAKSSKTLLEALQSTKMSEKSPVKTFSGNGKSRKMKEKLKHA